MNKLRDKVSGIFAENNSISILVLITLATSVLATFIEFGAIKHVQLLIVVSLSYLAYSHLNRQGRKSLFNILFFSLFLWFVFSLLVVYRKPVFYKPFAITYFVNIYLSVLIGFIIVHFQINVKYLKLLYYIVALFFLFSFVVLDIPYFVLTGKASGAPLGIALMSLLIPILYLEYRDSQKISILPLLLQIMVLVFTSSRISLGYSLLLLTSALFIYVKSNTRNLIIRIFEYSMLGIMLVMNVYLVASNSTLSVFEKFQEMSMDTHGREDIWDLYFNNFTIIDLFTGKNVVVPFYDFDSFPNPHNSWIQLHSLLGIIGIFFMFFLLWITFVYFRKRLFYSLIIISLILLGFFNTIFFFYPTDWALYIFMFEYFRTKGEKQKSLSRCRSIRKLAVQQI